MTPPEGDSPLEPGTIIANNYRVTARLGGGGMGTVYLADNITISQQVVVKVLRAGELGAGQEEAEILARLQHPNVVTVYAHDPAHDSIVMEFLDGTSLSALLEKGIEPVEAIRVALSMAEALAAVHRRGLVHRDLKPENVMLALNVGASGGRPVDWLKLIDFGLALKAGRRPPVLLGTPEFCGPEQFFPEEVAHPGNDVYALGVIIFQMMTGVLPFDGPRGGLPALHINQPPPGLVDTLVGRLPENSLDPGKLALLEDLDELVQQMLAKPTEDRPSAAEVARQLIRLESSFAEGGTFVGTARSVARPSSRSATATERVGLQVATATQRPSLRREGYSEFVFEPGPEGEPELELLVAPAPSPPARPLPPLENLDFLKPTPEPPKSRRGLILALALLVLALAVAVVMVVGRQVSPEQQSPSDAADELEPLPQLKRGR